MLSFSEEARANVIRWFMERFTENEYRYQNEMGLKVDVSVFTLEGKVIEGYQLINRIEGEDTVDEVYVGENGEMLFFTAMSSEHEGDMYVVSDKNEEPLTVYVRGRKMDLYLSGNQEESNVIVWQGSDGVLFSIQGIIEKEQLIEMAGRIE